MGKVVYEDPIHHISGKISRKYRTCYNYRKWSDRKYTSVHGDRTTPASTEELKVRAKFKVVRQAALQRSMDLSHLTYDQMDFIAERKAQGSAFKYTTYKGQGDCGAGLVKQKPLPRLRKPTSKVGLTNEERR